MAKYTLKRRAEQQEETRRRIVEAIVELHKTVGPVKTTITAIAEGAGVERLTVYRHFPTDVELFRACSDHWRAAHPPPDLNRWTAIDDPRERLRVALFDIYQYYAEVAPMLGNVLRDAELLPVLANQLAGYRHFVALAQTLLANGFTCSEEQGAALRAAIGHAVSFDTWRSLVETQELSTAQARDLMVALVRSAAEPMPAKRTVTQATDGKDASMRYAVVISQTDTGYSAYPPDLPGVGVAGATLDEVERLIEEAIEFHIEGLRLHGEPIPEPTTRAYTVEVA